MKENKNWKRTGLVLLVMLTMIISPSITARIDIDSDSIDYTGSDDLTMTSDSNLNIEPTDDTNFTSDAIPTANNTYDLGSNALRWNNIYGTYFFGDGSGLTGLPSGFTYSDWFDQDLNTTNSPTFAGLTLDGNLDMNSNDINNANDIEVENQLTVLNDIKLHDKLEYDGGGGTHLDFNPNQIIIAAGGINILNMQTALATFGVNVIFQNNISATNATFSFLDITNDANISGTLTVDEDMHLGNTTQNLTYNMSRNQLLANTAQGQPYQWKIQGTDSVRKTPTRYFEVDVTQDWTGAATELFPSNAFYLGLNDKRTVNSGAWDYVRVADFHTIRDASFSSAATSGNYLMGIFNEVSDSGDYTDTTPSYYQFNRWDTGTISPSFTGVTSTGTASISAFYYSPTIFATTPTTGSVTGNLDFIKLEPIIYAMPGVFGGFNFTNIKGFRYNPAIVGTPTSEYAFYANRGNFRLFDNYAMEFGSNNETQGDAGIYWDGDDLVIDTTIVDDTADTKVIGNLTANFYHAEGWYHNHDGIALNFGIQDHFYNLTFNDTRLYGFTCDDDQNLTCVVPGLYSVNFVACGSGQNNHEYILTVGIDGVGQDALAVHKKLNSGGDIIGMSGTGFIELSADDKVTLMVKDWKDTGASTYHTSNLNLVRIGD